MANSRIKGVTIELDGNTSKLNDAISKSDQKAKVLEKELREVNKALKLDPKNVVLVSQKQDLLSKAVNTTSERLGVLKQSQKQVEQQFANKSIGADQYRAFQREVVSTEATLKALSNQATSSSKNQDRLAQSTKDFSTLLKVTGKGLDDYTDLLGPRMTESIRNGTASTEQMNRAIKLVGKEAIGTSADLKDIQTALRGIDDGTSIDKVKGDLHALGKSADSSAKSVESLGERLNRVGSKMTSVGRDLSLYLTTPILGFATASATVGSSFEASMSEVSAISGATGSNLQALEDKAREMGATTKFSASEAAQALKFMSLAGWDSEKSIAALGGVLDLAAASGMDLASTSDLVTDYMSAFGIEAEKSAYFADVLAYAQKNSNTSVQNLGDAFKNTAAVMNAGGQTVETTTSLLAMMANQGFKGAEAGTALTAIMRDMTARMKDGAIQIGDTSIKVSDAEGNYRDLSEILLDVTDATDGMGDAERAAALSSTFTADSIKGLNLILNAGVDEAIAFEEGLRNSTGTAKEMAAVMSDNLRGRLLEMKSALEEVAITIFQSVQPALESLIGFVSEMAKKFGDLSPKTQNLILVFAGIAAALGPVLVVLGLLATSIGALAPVVGILGVALAALASPVGLVVAGLAAVGLGAAYVVKELNKSSLETENWSKKVSDSTAKAVGGFLDLETEATNALNQLNWSGTHVTQETADNITGIYQEMGDQVLTEMKSSHTSELNKMREHFKTTSSLTDQEAQSILSRAEKHNADKERATKAGTDRITEIFNSAAKDNRKLTKTEQTEVNKIQETMKKNAVKYMSESEAEQKAILESLKRDSSKISAQQAAEVVKNSKKQKDETVKEADEQYNETVKWAIRQRDETGVLSAEEADKIIKEAKKSREDTVKEATRMHKDVVKEAKSQATEHVNQVDWESGEVKTKWQVMKDDVTGKMKDIGADIKSKWDTAWSDTSKYVGEISKTTSEKFDGMVSSVTGYMGEVVSTVTTKWNEAQSFLEGIDLMQIGKDVINGFLKGINSMFSLVTGKMSEIASAIPDVVKKVLNIKSPSRVMKQIGEWTVQGLVNGMDSLKYEPRNKMDSITRGVLRSTKDFATQLAEINKGMLSNNKDYNQKLQQVNQVREREIQDSNARLAEMYRDSAEKEAKDIERAGELLAIGKWSRLDYEKELLQIEKIYSDYRAKEAFKEAEILISIEKGYKETMISLEKDFLDTTKGERFKAEKEYIDNLKKSGQLTLTEEIKLYENLKDIYADGSEAKTYYETQAYNAKKEINDKLLKLNETYVKKIQDANQKLIAGEDALNNKYNQAYNSRVDAIRKYMGTFDEFAVKNEKTGQDLINNLQSQVDGLKDWESVMASLGSRIDNEELLKELEALGPQSLGQLQALNSLSDDELTKYADLYEEKFSFAKEKATNELSGMREDVDKEISTLRDETAKQLEAYEKEWATSIGSITTGVKDEFFELANDMPSIGKNVIQGLQDGLSAMTGPLLSQAQAIADAVSSTIKKALDINSPSRVMKGFGLNIGEGLIIGMDDMVSKVAQASSRLAEVVIDAQDSLSLSAQKTSANALYSNGISSTVDNRKNFNPKINIYTTESPEKVMQRELRRMAFAF